LSGPSPPACFGHLSDLTLLADDIGAAFPDR